MPKRRSGSYSDFHDSGRLPSILENLPTTPRFDMVRTMDETNVKLTSCPHCAAQMPETAAFCPGCGLSMQTEARSQGKVGFLSERIAGAVAYFTFVPAIVFLVLEPYKKNRFVRFHAVQCLAVWGTLIGLAIVLKLAGLLLFIIPVLGPLLVVLPGWLCRLWNRQLTHWFITPDSGLLHAYILVGAWTIVLAIACILTSRWLKNFILELAL